MNSKPDVELQLFFFCHTSVSYPQAVLGHTHPAHSHDSRVSTYTLIGGLSRKKTKEANAPHLPHPNLKLSFYFCQCIISVCAECKVVRIINFVKQGIKTDWKHCW